MRNNRGDSGTSSVRDNDTVNRSPFGRPDQVLVRDPDRVQRAFEFALPIVKEAMERREVRRRIVILPDIELQESRVVRQMVMDFHRGQTIAGPLQQKLPARRHWFSSFKLAALMLHVIGEQTTLSGGNDGAVAGGRAASSSRRSVSMMSSNDTGAGVPGI